MSPIVSGGSGGGSGVGALLFDSTLGADAASIDTGAAGIAQTQNVLDVYILARTDEATVNSRVGITVNNDGSAIYDNVQVSGVNVTAAGNNTLAQTLWSLVCPGNTQTAGVFAALWLTIPGYAQTTAQKSGAVITSSLGTAAANTAVVVYALNYRATTAISRMKIANSGGTVLRAGSRLLILDR